MHGRRRAESTRCRLRAHRRVYAVCGRAQPHPNAGEEPRCRARRACEKYAASHAVVAAKHSGASAAAGASSARGSAAAVAAAAAGATAATSGGALSSSGSKRARDSGLPVLSSDGAGAAASSAAAASAGAAASAAPERTADSPSGAESIPIPAAAIAPLRQLFVETDYVSVRGAAFNGHIVECCLAPASSNDAEPEYWYKVLFDGAAQPEDVPQSRLTKGPDVREMGRASRVRKLNPRFAYLD